MKLILKLFKKVLSKFRKTSEKEYYKYLFTESELYSKPNPNNEEQFRWEHIKQLLNEIEFVKSENQNKLIIDFGCGRGWLANLLSNYGNVIGIEPVESVVEHGLKIYPKLQLIKGSFEVLANYKADLIVSSEVVEHIPDEKKQMYFKSIFNALHTSGYFIITTPRKEALTEWSKYFDPSQPIEEWMSEDQIMFFATNAGFSVVKLLRYSMKPIEDANPIEIYQQWLLKKN